MCYAFYYHYTPSGILIANYYPSRFNPGREKKSKKTSKKNVQKDIHWSVILHVTSIIFSQINQPQ